jgi:hypothetical protein
MAGSVKGRTILMRAARPSAQFVPRRVGSCCWCGADVPAPLLGTVPCGHCGSFEVDWPPDPPPRVVERRRDTTHLPGVIAYRLLGARIYGPS